MSTLAEFLRNKVEEESSMRLAREGRVSEWISAVHQFLETLDQWLKLADPGGQLRVSLDSQEVNEEDLGKYSVPFMQIQGFGKAVRVTPRSRETIATHKFENGKLLRAKGRLNISSGIDQVALYRFREPGLQEHDVWMIEDPNSGMRRFDREEFEKVLVSLLK